MHVIAITRLALPLEQEVPVLARWLSATPYDLRLRLSSPPPIVIATVPDETRARELVTQLRARGHGAVSCELGALDAPSVPRELELGPSGVSGRDEHGRPFELPYAQMQSLVRATDVLATERSITTETKKVALGRALMTGGLLPRKTVTSTRTTDTEERQPVLYVFRHSLVRPLLLKEKSLRYQSLGIPLRATTGQNFALVIETLRARAPHALFDERLVTNKRKTGLSSVAGTAKERTLQSSNVAENQLAATLITLAAQEDDELAR